MSLKATSLLKLKSKYCKLAPEQRLYDLSIPIVGLTGGIATGKSTVSEILKQQGVALIDADALVKDIYALNETKKLVKKLAPEAITDETIEPPAPEPPASEPGMGSLHPVVLDQEGGPS